ncbi:serine/arginine repetitive matrix protein 3-like [Agelaius tricolor]|uniref:serine/arginine repetitive matrix protein 3-like n=1 Tax=Agelaius tricolor TaxID=9191 RepID=UPI0039F246CE
MASTLTVSLSQSPIRNVLPDCVNIAKRRRRSGGTYSSPRGGGGRYRGGGAGRGGTGRASPASTSDFSALPHPPPPPRPREEPGGAAAAAAAAAAGRTAPLPRPAAAAQHRPAGGEARRAEPSGGATGRGGPAARLGADRLAGTLRLPVEPVASPSAGSSEGRCTHHSAPFSLRDTRASEGSGRAGSCGSPAISLFSRSPLNIAVNALAVLVIRLQLLLLLLVVFSFLKDCRLLIFSGVHGGDKDGLPRHGCNGCLKQETDTLLVSFISDHWESELEGR